MSRPLHYHFTQAPKAVRRARLDNIALVPATLLPFKDTYQTIANNLPGQGVLIFRNEKKERITRILECVAAYFRQKGHVVFDNPKVDHSPKTVNRNSGHSPKKC